MSLSERELIAAIDDIPGGDPENAHATLDDLLLNQCSAEVQTAVSRLMRRCRWWACA